MKDIMKKNKSTKKIWRGIRLNKMQLAKFFLIVFIFSLPALYFYSRYQNLRSTFSDPDKMAQKKQQQLISRVAKIIELPSGEDPTIFTVSDLSKLKNQPFFDRAKEGDKLLVFNQVKKAILYRPSTNKIIEVGPVNAQKVQVIPTTRPVKTKSIATTTPTPIQTKEPIAVAIYNSTQVAGLAALTERELTKKFSQIEVVKKADAKNNYQETLVIDLSGENRDMAQQIAQTVSGKLTDSFPVGEATPEADVLIILGK